MRPRLRYIAITVLIASVPVTLSVLTSRGPRESGRPPDPVVQTVATGARRGAGETRTPMLCNLAGHWLIGLPVAYTLCFNRHWGVVGLWSGLSLGLILIGAALVVAWHRRSGHAAWV